MEERGVKMDKNIKIVRAYKVKDSNLVVTDKFLLPDGTQFEEVRFAILESEIKLWNEEIELLGINMME